MEAIKFTLCAHCAACPEVEITDQGVTIGEAPMWFGCPTPNGMNSSHSSSAATLAKSKPGPLSPKSLPTLPQDGAETSAPAMHRGLVVTDSARAIILGLYHKTDLIYSIPARRSLKVANLR